MGAETAPATNPPPSPPPTSQDNDGSPRSALQCWENSVGEEFYKLTIFNFLLTVAFAFLVSLPRR